MRMRAKFQTVTRFLPQSACVAAAVGSLALLHPTNAQAALSLTSPVTLLATQNPTNPSPTLAQVAQAVTTATQTTGTVPAASTMTVCPSGCTYALPSVAVAAALNAETTLVHTITVSIADGVYQETGQIYTESVLGKYVRVVGDVTDNSKVVINFTKISGTNFGGFVANLGGMFGYIDGLTLNGVGAQTSNTPSGTSWTAQSYAPAIGALSGGYIGLGPHMTINHFYYGISADNNGLVYAAEGDVTVTDAGDVGVMARGNGIIVCSNCHVNRAVDNTPNGTPLGCGFDAERGGELFISGSTTQNTFISGVCSLTGGNLQAQNVIGLGGLNGFGPGATVIEASTADLTGSSFTGYSSGIYASSAGTAVIDNATVSHSSGDGIVADGGTLTGNNVTSKNNAAYGFHVFHQGSLTLTASLANAVNNGIAPIATEDSGTFNGAGYLASTSSVN